MLLFCRKPLYLLPVLHCAVPGLSTICKVTINIVQTKLRVSVRSDEILLDVWKPHITSFVDMPDRSTHRHAHLLTVGSASHLTLRL